MAIGDSYDVTTYRLRAGPPMPIAGAGDFVTHTFMAEKGITKIFQCAESLPSSLDFRGRGGTLVAASFSRLNVAGGRLFQGKKVYTPSFVDEDSMSST